MISPEAWPWGLPWAQPWVLVLVLVRVLLQVEIPPQWFLVLLPRLQTQALLAESRFRQFQGSQPRLPQCPTYFKKPDGKMDL